MEIKINNKTLDVTLDGEKTIGEIMAALEEWLENSGHRVSGIAIDGQTMDLSSLEEAFSRDIDDIKTLDILTSSITDLTVMCLFNLLGDAEEYDNIGFEEKQKFADNWKEKPAALFAYEQMPDIYALFVNAFSNNGINPQVLRVITEERLRETENPSGEFKTLGPIVEDICERLVDLPLDIQTGKDVRAAETIQAFSSLLEKIIRIFIQLEIQELVSTPQTPVSQMISEFTSTVKEFLQAYESHDTVLVGDLAEYEISPKLLDLYNTIDKIIIEPAVGKK